MKAEAIAKHLGGRKIGKGWMARCPVHDDRQPSLAIHETDDGKVLVHCHAGCDQWRVVSALCSLGLWPDQRQSGLRRPAPHAANKSQPYVKESNRAKAAIAIWQSASPADGTLVKTYLVSRCLHIFPPPTLRFHPGLKHPCGETWPAMVALVTGAGGTPLAIHRTFLARDGAGKAPVDPQKMMLGPCRGGAVRLGTEGAVLMIGEGIETCLAASQATGYPALAALSTSGLRGLILPETMRDVIILADGDDPGEAAARDCAVRWNRQGRRVRIARPPKGFDFNDVLAGRIPSVERCAG